MSIYLLGEGTGGVPFNRTFFNVTLGELLGLAGPSDQKRLRAFLTDGMVLDVCKIEELRDQYMTVRGFRKEGREGDACDVTIHVIPYGLIYRLEILPRGDEDAEIGFHWMPEGTTAPPSPSPQAKRSPRRE